MSKTTKQLTQVKCPECESTDVVEETMTRKATIDEYARGDGGHRQKTIVKCKNCGYSRRKDQNNYDFPPPNGPLPPIDRDPSQDKIWVGKKVEPSVSTGRKSACRIGPEHH